MRSVFSLFVLFLVLSTSCKKKDNSSPTFPVNKYRIKEIITQRNGQDYMLETFTYNGEELEKRSIQYLSSGNSYNELYTYGTDSITAILTTPSYAEKFIIELEGIKLKQWSWYVASEGDFELEYKGAFNYDGDKLTSYLFTGYDDSGSSSVLKSEFVYNGNKIAEVIGIETSISGEVYDSKVVYAYDGDNNTSQVQMNEVDGTWENYSKETYGYEGNKVVKIEWYDFEDSEWFFDDNITYEYNDEGYLSKEEDSYSTKIYTYEEGNGNASIANANYFFEEIVPDPYYKSGSLEKKNSEDVHLNILRNILK